MSSTNILGLLGGLALFLYGMQMMSNGLESVAGNKMKDILVEQLECDPEDITMESLLVDDLGADSLDAIDIVMSVEDTFKVEVPDEIIEKIETVGDIVNYIEDHI